MGPAVFSLPIRRGAPGPRWHRGAESPRRQTRPAYLPSRSPQFLRSDQCVIPASSPHSLVFALTHCEFTLWRIFLVAISLRSRCDFIAVSLRFHCGLVAISLRSHYGFTCCWFVYQSRALLCLRCGRYRLASGV